MMALIVSQFEYSYSLSQSKVEQEKHILVLNSYHRGFKWTDDTVTSFLETLESLSPEHKYVFYIEYLDWKKYPTQKNIENDDLAKRRGDIPKEEEVTFSPETISLTRPTMLIGQAAIRGAILFGRIEAESNDEEDSSPLLLTIVNPNS